MKAVSFTIVFAILSAGAHAGSVQDHQGRWLGELHIPNGPVLKIGVDLLTRADGSPWASFSSPDQNLYDAPVPAMKESADTIAIDFGFAAMTLRWAGDHFDAEYRQLGPPIALRLSKVDRFPRKPRPQTPQGPFPYRDEELAIDAGNGVTLGATLSIPSGGARSAVVLVHGSGPANRDGEVAGHQPFLVLADFLARRGIAVLRYDKRGIARSTGNYQGHTGADLSADLHAVLRTLRARKEFERIGTIGVSEGPGLAASVAAADPRSMDFLVSMAGGGMSGLDGMLLQDRLHLIDHGANPAELARLMKYVRQYYDIVIAEPETAPRIARLQALRASQTPEVQGLIERCKANVGTLSLDWAALPFVRASLLGDTRANWRRVRVPVLALNGSLDQQVPGKENLAGIAAALSQAENRQVTTILLPSLNHLFQTATMRDPEHYADIDETLAPVALEHVGAFIERLGRAPGIGRRRPD